MLETPAKLRVLNGDDAVSENRADRDNQQVTLLSETELAWLAGFLDADGMIRLHKGQKNANPSQRSLVPKVSFNNTCGATIAEIARRLSRLGITSGMGLHKKRSEQNPQWKPGCSVDVLGMKRVEPLLRCLEPYLVTKRIEAQIVLEFIERRKSRENRQKAYCERDYLAFEALAFLKRTRHLRDYTPSVEEILGEDIVRTNAKALEAAETTARLSMDQIRERGRRLVQHRWNKLTAKPVDYNSLKSQK